MQPCSIIFDTDIAVVDVENFSGGFSFTKMPAKLEDQEKKSHQQLFESFFLHTATSLPFSTAPKPTHALTIL